MNGQPIRIDKVFDDPAAVRAAVERHGPYRAMASYLPVSATRGGTGNHCRQWDVTVV
jgi:hypothetical protein